jgi:hypothetical protein
MFSSTMWQIMCCDEVYSSIPIIILWASITFIILYASSPPSFSILPFPPSFSVLPSPPSFSVLRFFPALVTFLYWCRRGEIRVAIFIILTRRWHPSCRPLTSFNIIISACHWGLTTTHLVEDLHTLPIDLSVSCMPLCFFCNLVFLTSWYIKIAVFSRN